VSTLLQILQCYVLTEFSTTLVNSVAKNTSLESQYFSETTLEVESLKLEILKENLK
jgi:hypothetical protein